MAENVTLISIFIGIGVDSFVLQRRETGKQENKLVSVDVRLFLISENSDILNLFVWNRAVMKRAYCDSSIVKMYYIC